MLYAYLDYPNPHMTLHLDSGCGFIRRAGDAERREIALNAQTISTELARIEGGTYVFGAQAGINGLWLQIDFHDTDFERAVARHVLRLLSRRYSPFRDCPVKLHCGA